MDNTPQATNIKLALQMWNWTWVIRYPNHHRTFQKLYSTIYALSSGQGKCGVAVIRISGVHAKDTIERMTSHRLLPKPRQAVLTSVYDPISSNQLDKGIMLWFPEPGSFTGEDVCELQIHGGRAVVTAVLAALSKLPDYRPAEPGEFTKRAFLAGKMDLTEVEGLADLIHAETEQQRKQALLQMEGSLGKLYSTWRELLLKSLAHVEAYIDFSEEENIEDDILQDTKARLENLANSLETHLKDSRRGERLRNGVRTVIIGEPNVGKSSLLNFLVKRPAAIVTPIAGTTRDVVEISIDIAGFPMVLADTAGIRKQTADIIEEEGIRRTREWTKFADLILLVHDSTKIKEVRSKDWEGLIDKELVRLDIGVEEQTEVLHVINKIDLLEEVEKEHLSSITTSSSAVCVSCNTEDGMMDFLERLRGRLVNLCGEPSRESPSFTQERHRYNLLKCIENLKEALRCFNENDISLASHSLRKSLRHLGVVTGHVTTDDVLHVIFKDFCVGK